jgi:DNA polymerase I-like protein with 3'-5' exonuclease and polymerase domains
MSYTLLQKQDMRPRPPKLLLFDANIEAALEPYRGQLWAVDTETTGVDASDPDFRVFGIGLANQDVAVYIHVDDLNKQELDYLKGYLKDCTLTAFNVMFDGSALMDWCGEWLNFTSCSYALFKNLSSEGYPGQRWNLETAQLDVLGWPDSGKDEMTAALKERKLGKGDMWQLPPDLVGRYCAADADAAWQLHTYLMCVAAQWPSLVDYHQRVFLTEVKLLALQHMRGIEIDPERKTYCQTTLQTALETSMSKFKTHELVAPHLAAYEAEARQKWLAAEPPKTTQAGTETKRWAGWKAKEGGLAERSFNVNSKPQLADLFYTKMGLTCTKFTETNKRQIDRKVLPSLGEPGKILTLYNKYKKQEGYLNRIIQRSERDGCVHPQFNSCGTVTTRLGGSGGLNLQQLPKDPAFLQMFRARAGYSIVQADLTAVEPTILAEFSRDKAMWQLYGPDAKQNDIYLFVAASIAGLGDKIREYYDPNNPTPEDIALAKKHCKKERNIAKTVHLASAYGASAPKIHETLKEGGVSISLQEVFAIHREYWKLFAGVKKFFAQLQNMWERNGGYIITAFGTPHAVSERVIKDIGNRFCQTSGHQVHQLWLYHTYRIIRERNAPMFPWFVDEHDSQAWETPTEYAKEGAQILVDAMAATNDELGMDIKIKADPAIGENLAEIKIPQEYAEWKLTMSK